MSEIKPKIIEKLYTDLIDFNKKYEFSTDKHNWLFQFSNKYLANLEMISNWMLEELMKDTNEISIKDKTILEDLQYNWDSYFAEDYFEFPSYLPQFIKTDFVKLLELFMRYCPVEEGIKNELSRILQYWQENIIIGIK